ncbi:hypothetical protein MNR02_13535 [Shinella sp. H4-D48]|uniref:hypothetical protein n=1 Tax=Shinella sp. H4-D48 TaxID=2925841 RepID=UPI001F53D89D|nr:hypothetical protein [Shinella sp. H4-D48]UNK37486.1 hypothetical protein MNR02_13535 [Shinella sp. H4-D48]
MTAPQPLLTVPLFARKVPAIVGHLTYSRVGLPNAQKRLAGRYALCPDIDLGRFKIRAVIDWLAVSVFLKRATQFQWLQSEIAGILGRTPFVKNRLGKPNDSSDSFEVRFQEPEMGAVLKAMAAIEARYGMERAPVVSSVEISVDFTPRVPGDLERAKIARVLMNHLLVEQDVITNIRDRPRTVWGRDQRSVARLIYDSKHLTAEENTRFLIETERDRAPFTDGTLEIGAKEGTVRWRVMDKVIDRQNVRAGTCVVLDEAEKRARIEVTLAQPEVEALGITALSDLKHLNFTRLQGRYFRFFFPTFTGDAALDPGRKSALQLWQDRQRAIKFGKSGGLSLKAMDRALAEQQAGIKRHALRDLHRRGLRLPAANRPGRGPAGSFVAFEELNNRTRTALRNLGKRIVAGFECQVEGEVGAAEGGQEG